MRKVQDTKLFFAVSVSLAVIADRKWKAAPEKVMRCWLPAVMGGTLLWTSVGECSWHFWETGTGIYV